MKTSQTTMPILPLLVGDGGCVCSEMDFWDDEGDETGDGNTVKYSGIMNDGFGGSGGAVVWDQNTVMPPS